MSHLEERVAEFVFEEMPAAELEAAHRHVAQCLECQGRVASFRKVRHSLEALPEVDLPRRIVFLPSEPGPGRRWLPLGWTIPAAAAAVILLAMLLVPVQIDWNAGGVQIAFGPTPAPTAMPEPAPAPLPDVQPIDYSALDYGRIAARLRDEQAAWLDTELDRRLESLNDTNSREIQRVRAEINYLSELQRVYWRDTLENASSIQVLAQLVPGREERQ